MAADNALSDVAHATEFGAAIRDMREAHGKTLAEVSATLRVRQTYLAAIEDGRFDDLPGATYASGFIRAYADYLGLDVPEVMRRYREIHSDKPSKAAATPPTPVVEGKMPTGFILFVAGLLALGAYGAWYYLTLHGRDASQVVAEIPEKIAKMVTGDEAADAKPAERQPATVTPEPAPSTDNGKKAEAPSEPDPVMPIVTAPAQTAEMASSATNAGPDSSASATTEVAQETQAAADAPPENQSAPDNAAASSVPVDETPVEPANAAGNAAEGVGGEAASATGSNETAAAQSAGELQPTAEVPPATPEPVTAVTEPPVQDSRIVLRATAASWVELRRENGDRVISRILKAGETYRVPPQDGIRMMTGNAGGIDILVDGKLLPSLGPDGAVRRDILLEPDALSSRRPSE